MKDVMIETDRFLLRSLIEDDVNNRYLSWINGENKSQYINYSSQERSIKEVRAYVSIRVNDPSVLFLGIFCEHIGNIKFRRSLYFIKDIKQGEVITKKHVKSIRPGFGLMPKYLDKVLGLKASHDVKRGTPVALNLIE